MLLTAVLLSAAPPAHAEPTIGNGSCDPGNACMWRYNNETGELLDARGCVPDWYCGLQYFTEWWYYGTTLGPDNRTSSLWHRSGNYPYLIVYQFGNGGGGGDMACFPQGVHINQTTLTSLDLNDKISSMNTSTVNDCNL